MKMIFKFLLLLPLFALIACEQGSQPETSAAPTEQAAEASSDAAAPAAEHAGAAAEEGHEHAG